MERSAKAARRQAERDLFEALRELGESLFDDALVRCDTEREASLLASATLVRALEHERVLKALARAA